MATIKVVKKLTGKIEVFKEDQILLSKFGLIG